MTYERTRRIEQRFRQALALIKAERVDAQRLAAALQVSRPTAHRIIAELKRRGYAVRSVHDEAGWRYEVLPTPNDHQSSDARR